MQKEQALSDTPQWSRAELIRTGISLNDAVR